MNLNQITLAVKDISAATEFYLKMCFIKIVDSPHYTRFMCPNGDSSFSLAYDEEEFKNGSTIYFEHEELDELVQNLHLKT